MCMFCSAFPSPELSVQMLAGSSGEEVSVPPIAPDELPPPYSPTPQGGIPMINCRVCQALINIEGKLHLHVVKCSVCQEATVVYNFLSCLCTLPSLNLEY